MNKKKRKKIFRLIFVIVSVTAVVATYTLPGLVGHGGFF